MVWLQKEYQMDRDYIIFQENGLFGAKNRSGEVIIVPQYTEMQPFSCGLSLVRNDQYQYAYVNTNNKQVVPFGEYSWCDPQFVCGYARVLDNHWGIIDTLGNIVVPLKYDKIWTIKEEYIFSIKAFIGDEIQILNLHQLANKTIFDGLKYLKICSIEEFKNLVNCEKLFVRTVPNTNQLYFTYGCNIGLAAAIGIPKEPVIAIVTNSSGKIFPLWMEKGDIGKSTLPIATVTLKKKGYSRTDNADNWSDPYGDEQAYYGGWSREDVESGLVDAYEGDLDARWNTD